MNNEEQSNSKLNKTVDVAVKTKKTISAFKKYKYIIIFGSIAFCVVILFMFLIMAMEAMGLLKDDSGGSNSGSVSSYGDLVANVNGANNEELWWPIGSEDITSSIELEGATLEFRSGEPVDTELTSEYGQRSSGFHSGIDISTGGDVYLIAMADGVVSYISANRDSGYNTQPNDDLVCSDYSGMVEIDIKYNNGLESAYLHLEGGSIPDYLQEGDKVYQGQVVGKMGNTGCSTGQHLHFEIYSNNSAVNPANYVSEENPRPITNESTGTSEEILNNSTSNPSGTSGDGQFVEGTSNQQTVCLTLKSYYSNNVVAGLMVNIEKESSFDPTNVTLDTNNEYSGGLFQWNAGRLTGLKSRHGDNWTSIANQIEYFQYEISTSESSTAPILADTTSSASEIAYDFCETFERAADCSPRADESLANKYLTYVNNGCK